MLGLTPLFSFGINRFMGKKRSKVDNNISYQTLDARSPLFTNLSRLGKSEQLLEKSGLRFAFVDSVPKRPDPVAASEDNFPTNRDMEVFKLRRENASLRDELDSLHDKMTVAIATVRDEIRKHELWLYAGKDESRGDLQLRVAHLKGVAERLESFQSRSIPNLEKLFAKGVK